MNVPKLLPKSVTPHKAVQTGGARAPPPSKKATTTETPPFEPSTPVKAAVELNGGAVRQTAKATSAPASGGSGSVLRVQSTEVLSNGVVHRTGRMPAADIHHKGNDVQLFWQSMTPPAGQPVRGVIVFHHGLKSHSGYFMDYAAQLAKKGYAVYAPDMRGHGRSVMGLDGVQKPPNAKLGSVDQAVSDLNSFFSGIEREQPGKPKVLVGHSVGGLVATAFAEQHPDVLSGLVPLDAGYLPAGLKTGLLPESGFSRDPAVVQQMKDDPLVFHGDHLGLTLPLLKGEAEVFHDAKQVKIPVLGIHGSADKITLPAGTNLFMKAKTPAAGDEELIIEGARHDPLHEIEPVVEQTKDAMNAFFDRLMPAPAK